MKRLISVILMSALFITLVSCGDTSSGSSVSGSSVSGSSSSTSTPNISSAPEFTENMSFTVSVIEWGRTPGEDDTVECEGTYSGELANGLPEGYGTFTATNAEGISWTYTGEFKNGRFHGQGTTVWDDSESYKESGTYIDGQYTPTTAELFAHIGPKANAPYSISSSNFEFIQSNQDIFPAITEESETKATSLIEEDLTYPMLTKTLNGREGQLYSCKNAVATQVFEDFLFGHTVTIMIVHDIDGNFYYILHDGALPDVYDNTPISFYGLPIASSGFDNIGGGTTNVIVLISSDVTAI